jgi:hypothetical protein
LNLWITSTANMEAKCFSEMLIPTRQITWHKTVTRILTTGDNLRFYNMTESFHRFLKSLKDISATVPQIRLRSLPSTSFPLIILSFNTVQYEVLTAY